MFMVRPGCDPRRGVQRGWIGVDSRLKCKCLSSAQGFRFIGVVKRNRACREFPTDFMSGTPPTIPKAQAQRGRMRSIVAAIGWLLVGIYFACAILVIAFRYWVLPDIGRYGTDIEQAMSRAIGERVTIGQ